MTAERTLRVSLIVNGVSHGQGGARIVDGCGGVFAGTLSLAGDGQPMPDGWAEGILRPAVGPDLAVRLLATTGGRVYFSSRPVAAA